MNEMFDKFKAVFCALFGCSRIITSCMGHQYCGRCERQVGDTLAGVGIGDEVGIGHNCDKCRENYKKMTWRDKWFVQNPFTEKANG